MKKMSKNLWYKPEMIVLVRSNPEEAVLENCKTTSLIGAYGGNAVCQNPGGQQCAALTAT